MDVTIRSHWLNRTLLAVCYLAALPSMAVIYRVLTSAEPSWLTWLELGFVLMYFVLALNGIIAVIRDRPPIRLPSQLEAVPLIALVIGGFVSVVSLIIAFADVAIDGVSVAERPQYFWVLFSLFLMWPVGALAQAGAYGRTNTRALRLLGYRATAG